MTRRTSSSGSCFNPTPDRGKSVRSNAHADGHSPGSSSAWRMSSASSRPQDGTGDLADADAVLLNPGRLPCGRLHRRHRTLDRSDDVVGVAVNGHEGTIVELPTAKRREGLITRTVRPEGTAAHRARSTRAACDMPGMGPSSDRTGRLADVIPPLEAVLADSATTEGSHPDSRTGDVACKRLADERLGVPAPHARR